MSQKKKMNSERETTAGFSQKVTLAWQKMLESGQISLYMSLKGEEIEELRRGKKEIGKNEYIAAYLRVVEEMCQKEKK